MPCECSGKGCKCSPKIKITVSEIKKLQERRKEINDLSLDEIEFIDDDGKIVEISETIKSDFAFTGLNVTDFIDTDFYKTGFIES